MNFISEPEPFQTTLGYGWKQISGYFQWANSYLNWSYLKHLEFYV